MVLDMQRRLVGADYFGTVTVTPHPEKAVERAVPIAVELSTAKRDIYSGAFYASTDRGAGVELGVQRRWLNDRGHKGRVELDIAQRLQSVELSYRIPLPGTKQRVLGFGGTYRRRNHRVERLADGKIRRQRVAQVGRLHCCLRPAVSGRRLRDRHRTRQFLAAVPRRRPHARQVRSAYIRAPRLQLYREPAVDSRRSADRYALCLGHDRAEMVACAGCRQPADPAWRSGQDEGRRFRPASAGIAVLRRRRPFHTRFWIRRNRQSQRGGRRDRRRQSHRGQRRVRALLEQAGWRRCSSMRGDAFLGSDFYLHMGVGAGVRWKSPVGVLRLDLAYPVQSIDSNSWQIHFNIGPDF